jgi:hypothetical protein
MIMSAVWCMMHMQDEGFHRLTLLFNRPALYYVCLIPDLMESFRISICKSLVLEAT